MPQTPYKFVVLSGMPGCLPNYVSGPMIANTRKELADILRDELEMLDYPKNRFSDFKVKRLWRRLQMYKSGASLHSRCNTHNGEYMSIQGMTDAEYTAAVEASE